MNEPLKEIKRLRSVVRKLVNNEEMLLNACRLVIDANNSLTKDARDENMTIAINSVKQAIKKATE